MKKLELDAFLSYRFLSELSFSPDGKQAAAVVTEADADENSYRSAIWLYRNRKWLKLTGLDHERGYIWEDDTHILFPAVRTKKEKEQAEAGDLTVRYYRISTKGGEALPAFTLPFAGALKEKVGRGLWLAGGSFDAAYPDYYKMSKEERAKAAKEKKDNADYEVMTEIPFYHNGGSFSSGDRSGLFLYHEKTGKTERITPASVNAESPVVLNGKIWYLASEHQDVVYNEKTEVWCYDLKTKENRKAAANDQLDYYTLALLDGRIIAVAEEKTEYHIDKEPQFYAVNEEKGTLELFRENLDTLFNSVGSDCRFGRTRSVKCTENALYIAKTSRNDGTLFKILPDGSEEAVLLSAGSMDDFDVSSDGQILVTGMYDGKLQEVYEVKDGKPVQISSFNEAVLKDVYVSGYHKMTIQSQGWDIDGWVLYPKDYDETKKYPAILDVHGGPRTVFGEVFFHEMQLWANMGYFVFFCNPVGGSGRGFEFADITDKYGTIDFENIMDFTDAVLEAYPQIDQDRVGCTGGSYGGYMSNWIMGHTDRFACIATQRSISNWISFYGMSDIGYFFTKNQHGYDIYSDAGVKRLWELSPLKYINNMKTPTLFIHSNEDYRCPMEQGMQLFTALKEKGVPARFVYFRGENHELSRSGKPLHRKRRLQEITDWMEKYLK